MTAIIIVLIISVAVTIALCIEPVLDHIEEIKRLKLKEMDKNMEFLAMSDKMEEERLRRLEREDRLNGASRQQS